MESDGKKSTVSFNITKWTTDFLEYAALLFKTAPSEGRTLRINPLTHR
jgi:hypothetical protein